MTKLATFSFDDGGWQDATVMELFHSMGVPCMFYLSSKLLLESVYNGLAMDAIRHLYDGWEIGGHARTHARLNKLNRVELMEEVAGCRRDLAQFFERQVASMAYPYGDHNATVMQAARDAGYRWARTCMRGNPIAITQKHDPMSQPITGILEDCGRCDTPVEAALFSGYPIHVVGHSWAVVRHNRTDKLKAMITTLRGQGYRIVPTDQFYMETST